MGFIKAEKLLYLQGPKTTLTATVAGKEGAGGGSAKTGGRLFTSEKEMIILITWIASGVTICANFIYDSISRADCDRVDRGGPCAQNAGLLRIKNRFLYATRAPLSVQPHGVKLSFLERASLWKREEVSAMLIMQWNVVSWRLPVSE